MILLYEYHNFIFIDVRIKFTGKQTNMKYSFVYLKFKIIPKLSFCFQSVSYFIFMCYTLPYAYLIYYWCILFSRSCLKVKYICIHSKTKHLFNSQLLLNVLLSLSFGLLYFLFSLHIFLLFYNFYQSDSSFNFLFKHIKRKIVVVCFCCRCCICLTFSRSFHLLLKFQKKKSAC